LDQFQLAESRFTTVSVEIDVAITDSGTDVIQHLLPISVRIPKLRIIDVEFEFRKTVTVHIRGALENH